HGVALRQLANANDMIEVPGIGERAPRSMSRQTLAEVIEPRVEELFSLVQQVLRESGFEELLSSGVVLTGGSSVMQGMVEQGVEGVEFIAINTDAQVLSRNRSRNQIQLGTSGLGSGARPEEARAVAVAERERLEEAVAGAHMVFITAGMGGGTGTGAAPVIADVARSLGILTVAVVTKPFTFEGSKRMKTAEAGLEALAPHVDSLIVILNDKLEEVLGEDVTQEDAFKAADDVLNNAVAGIAEIINNPGLGNV